MLIDCFTPSNTTSDCSTTEGWIPVVYAIRIDHIDNVAVSATPQVITELLLKTGKKATRFTLVDDAVEVTSTSDGAKLLNNWTHEMKAMLHKSGDVATVTNTALGIGRWVYVIQNRVEQAYIVGIDLAGKVQGVRNSITQGKDNNSAWVINAKSEEFLHSSPVATFSPTGGFDAWVAANITV